jgi:hypothetical protein
MTKPSSLRACRWTNELPDVPLIDVAPITRCPASPGFLAGSWRAAVMKCRPGVAVPGTTIL